MTYQKDREVTAWVLGTMLVSSLASASASVLALVKVQDFSNSTEALGKSDSAILETMQSLEKSDSSINQTLQGLSERLKVLEGKPLQITGFGSERTDVIECKGFLMIMKCEKKD
jgi:hypothetical protein